ncbi:hypothetical protein DFQ28_004287 [Apophysomyces sp. BC1034]|nr:hypothetical protein DFQ28_004287 [Apophysomyces sp. BC1034]
MTPQGSKAAAPARKRGANDGRRSQTTKQNADERAAKRQARDDRKAQVDADRETPHKHCPTCIKASQVAVLKVTLASNEEERQRHRAEEQCCITKSRTHSRASNKDCTGYKERQAIKTKARLGGKVRPSTIKHGLAGLLQILPVAEQAQFLQGVETVVDYNRKLAIQAHLFLTYYLTYRLDAGLPIMPAFFDMHFVNGIFQLLLGGRFTSRAIFSQAIRDDLDTAFARYIEMFPNARCQKVPSPAARPPIAFSGLLASTATQIASTFTSHVVENFDAYYMSYIEQQCLTIFVQDLKRGQAKAYAQYAYQASANDPQFPPEWPTLYHSGAIDDVLNDALQTAMDEATDEWAAIHDQIQQDRRRRQDQGRTRSSSVASTSTDPLPESMEAPSPAVSISTIGSMGASQLDISADSFSVETSTLTAYPQLFLPVLFRILQVMENWNVADQELPATPQPEATPVWTRHWLQSLPAWESLKHRRRTSLVRAITKLVNDQVLFDPARLPVGFDQASIDTMTEFIHQAQQELAEGTFTPPTYLVRSQARLFTIAPVAAFTRKYVKIDHETLGIILRHFGLGQHTAMPHTPVPADRPHANFNIIDLSKMKASENSLSTDGFATSITFKKAVPENPLPSLALDDIKEEHLAQCKIWGVDLGVSEIFVAVDGSDAGTYEDPSTAANAPHQVLKFSAAEYFTKAGMKKTNASILEWKRADGITAIEAALPSPKSARMSNIEDHIRAVLQALPRLLSHYGARYQQLRFHSYRGKQKIQKEMVDIFLTGGAKYNGDHHNVSEAVALSRTRADGQMRSKRKARPHIIAQAAAPKP